jgi:hypothetical protein
MSWGGAGAVLLLAALAPQSSAAQSSDPTTRELLAIINERSKAEITRIDVQEKANNQRFDAQEKAVAAALAAAKEAVSKAEAAAEKRFDAVNEFRATLKDQQSTLMPRAETLTLLKALDEKIQTNTDRVNQVVSESRGANWLWGVICATGGLIAGTSIAAMALYRKTRR